MPSGTEGLRAAAGLLVVACALAQAQVPGPAPGPAHTHTLYKLVDKAGKVTYVDKVPRGFVGEVTPITMDPAHVPQVLAPRAAPPAVPAGVAVTPQDALARKRALRDRLQANIDRARVKLADARAALEGGGDPKEDEYQTIQQRFDTKSGETRGPRSNCAKVPGPGGKPIWRCATIVPGDAFFDRQKALEDAVKAAEAELEAAQREYQRNID